MTRLLDLPPEVFAIITGDCLDGFGIAKLYFCGNSRLIDLFCRRGGLTTFKMAFEPHHRVQFPSLVYQFKKLVNLQIVPASKTSWQPLIGDFDITRLPPALKTLNVSFRDAFLSVFEITAPNADEAPQLLPLPISRLLPELRELTLVKSNAPAQLHDPNFLVWLPQTLCSYQMSSVPALFTLPYVPSSLTSLEVSFLDGVGTLGSITLPPTLLHLDVMNCPTPRLLLAVTSPLISLRIHYANSVLEDDCYFDAWMHLPRTLEKIAFSCSLVTLEMLRSLPPGLTDLNIVCSRNLQISEHDLLLLPRSLTAVSLGFIRLPDLPSLWPEEGDCPILQNLPPKLTSMKLCIPFELSPNAAKALPRKLQSIEIGGTLTGPFCSARYGAEPLQLLPPSLTLLTILPLVETALGVLPLPLPKTLKTLLHYANYSAFFASIPSLDQLETLIASDLSINDAQLAGLETILSSFVFPSSLTSLTFSADGWDAIPALTRSPLPNLTNLNIEGLPETLNQDFFQSALPSSLRTLTLSGTTRNRWLAKDILIPGTFCHLTRLQSLRLTTFREIEENHLGHFPLSLTVLSLSANSIILKQKGVDLLPKGLVSLTLNVRHPKDIVLNWSAFPNLRSCPGGYGEPQAIKRRRLIDSLRQSPVLNRSSIM